MVPVRGIELRVTTQFIFEFYNTSYYENNFVEESDLEYFRNINMDSVINYLTECRGEWKYHP
ncbi:hypothetical protein Golob_002530, partial [Gossypium lobatum]|nr:hypothetical protein [Gossypium lobatum]